jgi:uncharacterized protein
MWSVDCQKAFEEVEHALTHAPVLYQISLNLLE